MAEGILQSLGVLRILAVIRDDVDETRHAFTKMGVDGKIQFHQAIVQGLPFMFGRQWRILMTGHGTPLKGCRDVVVMISLRLGGTFSGIPPFSKGP